MLGWVVPAKTHRFFGLASGRAAALLVLVAASLLLVEIVARVLHRPGPVRRVYDPFAYRIPQPGLVDTFVGLDGEPVTVRLNELGMRGPSVAAPAEPDAVTLVFLGGSTTENYGYRREDTFPEQVGVELRHRLGQPVRVLNAGMSAATTATSLARLQHQVLDLEPSLVVAMHGINDLLSGFHPGFRSDGRHLPRPPTATARPRSYFFDWIRSRRLALPPPRTVSAVTVEVQEFTDFAARRAFERNLRSMAAVASAHGIPILFLTQATMYDEAPQSGDVERFRLRSSLAAIGQLPDVPTLARGMRAFNDTVLRVADQAGVPVFDLAARVPRKPELLYDDCHLTRLGNARVARELVPVVEAVLRRPPGAEAG